MTRLVEYLDEADGLIHVDHLPDLDAEIARVVVHDTTASAAAGAGDALVGIGVDVPGGLSRLLREAAGIAAVVVSHPAPLGPDVVDAARSRGCALLRVHSELEWPHLLARWSSVDQLARRDPVAATSAGDLAALADAAAAVVGGAVAMHDPQLQLLAYAGDPERADRAWVDTVLTRRMPAWLSERWTADGTLGRLSGAQQPLLIEPPGARMRPRLACPIRSGTRLLGSLWATVSGRPADVHVEVFARCGELAASQLARMLAEADRARRVENEQIAALIHGGAGTDRAAAELGLRRGPYRALALGVRAPDGSARAQLIGRLRARLEAAHAARPATPVTIGELRGTLFVVLGGNGRAQPQSAGVAWLATVAAGDRELQTAAIAGIGGEVDRLADLPRSRAEAERALAVVRSDGDRQIAAYADVWSQALVHYLRSASLPPELLVSEPLRRLIDHDATHATQYELTLRAYYDAFGDAAKAARALHVHTNTVRYRLRRIRELCGVDVDAAELRTALSLQLALRASRLAEPPS